MIGYQPKREHIDRDLCSECCANLKWDDILKIQQDITKKAALVAIVLYYFTSLKMTFIKTAKY